MSLARAGGLRIVLVSLALVGLYCGTAGAGPVRSAGADGMDHWYGRAGGLTGSDEVSGAEAWKKPGQPLEVGIPANSGSLYFNDQGGIRTEPNMRSNEGAVSVGLPANSGSLYFNDQGGIRTEANMRSGGESATAQQGASSQRESSPTEH
jgi:hypothetical protein